MVVSDAIGKAGQTLVNICLNISGTLGVAVKLARAS